MLMSVRAHRLSCLGVALLACGTAGAAETDFLPIRFHGPAAPAADADTVAIRFHQLDAVDPTEEARSREIQSRDMPGHGSPGALRASAPPAPEDSTYLLPAQPAKTSSKDKTSGLGRKDDSTAGGRRELKLGGDDSDSSDSGSGWGWLADSVYDGRPDPREDSTRRGGGPLTGGPAGQPSSDLVDDGAVEIIPLPPPASESRWSSWRDTRPGGSADRSVFGSSDRLGGSATPKVDLGSRRSSGGGPSPFVLTPPPAFAPAPQPLVTPPALLGDGPGTRANALAPPPASSRQPPPASRAGSSSPFDRKSPFDR